MKKWIILALLAALAPSLAFAKCDGTITRNFEEKDNLIWDMIHLEQMYSVAEIKTKAAMDNLRTAIADQKVADWAERKISDIQKRCITQAANATAAFMRDTYTVDELKALPALMALKDKETVGALTEADKTKLAGYAATPLMEKLNQTQAQQTKINQAIEPELNAEMGEVTKQIAARQMPAGMGAE